MESGEGIESPLFLRIHRRELAPVESGEGIERAGALIAGTSVSEIVWNPVKELKVVLICLDRELRHEVESGEGIERL